MTPEMKEVIKNDPQFSNMELILKEAVKEAWSERLAVIDIDSILRDTIHQTMQHLMSNLD